MAYLQVNVANTKWMIYKIVVSKEAAGCVNIKIQSFQYMDSY